MRAILFVLFVHLIFVSLASAAESITITLDQQKFAESIVRTNPEIVNAAWYSSTDLWVETTDPEKDKADSLSLAVLKSGASLNLPFCVIVHAGDYVQITKHCIEQ